MCVCVFARALARMCVRTYAYASIFSSSFYSLSCLFFFRLSTAFVDGEEEDTFAETDTGPSPVSC